ncbi:MAG: peptide chain release factor 1 [Bacillota bacterium]|nr:peptide chain release factor 1 [Bacillota bacterium]
MHEKLKMMEAKYEELSIKIGDPEVLADRDNWQRLVKEHSELRPIVEKYIEYCEIERQIADTEEMIKTADDVELVQMAKEELHELKQSMNACEQQVKMLLIPKDPNDERNVVFEIRAGAGGDEAGLFANELLRLYQKYAQSNRWKFEIVDISESGIGGIKDAVAMIKGKQVFSRMKYESGTHRVQRIPKTESGGRIHTSTVTIAVLPEADEVDIDFREEDLRIDTFRSSGNGGQSVNTTDSAVRITHIPTGLVVSCQDGKSQLDNKTRAKEVLRAKLYEIEQNKLDSERAEARKSQVGTGDRSAKIRTYNFPQSRVTDHRVPHTVHNLEAYMNGEIDEMLDTVAEHFRAVALSENEE